MTSPQHGDQHSQPQPEQPPTLTHDLSERHVTMAAPEGGPGEEVGETPGKKTKTNEEWLEELKAAPGGLSTPQAQERLAQYGHNTIEEKKQNPILKFLSFMWNPLSWAMEVAAIVAVCILDFADFGLIIFLLLLNACIGYYEEHNAGNAVAALKSKLAPTAKVYRDGVLKSIDAVELVPGDIMRVKFGDMVPADGRILEASGSIKVDQSSLTGESLAVERREGTDLYSGSLVKMGEADRILVTSTGRNTFFGRSASLVAQTHHVGHFQIVLRTIGFFCIGMIAIFVLVELLVQFIARDKPCIITFSDGCPTLSNALVLIIGGIPIAMPTVLSVTMALGAYNLARKDAVVTRLTAVEEMAGMDVLCSDKTGTLTLNKLSVAEPFLLPAPGPSSEGLAFLARKFDLFLHAALASRPENEDDAIDQAMLASYRALHPQADEDLKGRFRLLRFIPFDPVSKRTMAEIESDAGVFWVTKGAPQVVLGMAAETVGERAGEVQEQILKYAEAGYRSLGVAATEPRPAGEERGPWVMDGLVPLFDPPRTDTAETIRRAQEMGIAVKMITGDQLAIAKETARLLGMGTEMHTTTALTELDHSLGEDRSSKIRLSRLRPRRKNLRRVQSSVGESSGDLSAMEHAGEQQTGRMKLSRSMERLSQLRSIFHRHTHHIAPQVIELVEKSDGFAEVYPEHKYGIVRVFQQLHHTVGMTGDGVNDAPALKKADIGIAVAGATDAARAASDIVLMTPGLFVVIDAIIGSREIFQRMKNYAIYSITTTIRIVLTFSILTLAFDFYFSSLATVFLAILNDGACMTVAKDIVKPSRNPNRWNLPEIYIMSTFLALYLTASSILFYVIITRTFFFQNAFKVFDPNNFQLIAILYLQVSISGMATLFIGRSRRVSYIDRPSFWMVFAFVTAQLIATLIAVYGLDGYPNNGVTNFDGCGWAWAGIIWVWCIIWYLVMDPYHFIIASIMNNIGYFKTNFTLKSKKLISKYKAMKERKRAKRTEV